MRKEEERKKALDARLRFEQERMEQERLEQEERERRYREREEQIEEHRHGASRGCGVSGVLGAGGSHAQLCSWPHCRRKQQSMEAEEARQRLKEQSIFVSAIWGWEPGGGVRGDGAGGDGVRSDGARSDGAGGDGAGDDGAVSLQGEQQEEDDRQQLRKSESEVEVSSAPRAVRGLVWGSPLLPGLGVPALLLPAGGRCHHCPATRQPPGVLQAAGAGGIGQRRRHLAGQP